MNMEIPCQSAENHHPQQQNRCPYRNEGQLSGQIPNHKDATAEKDTNACLFLLLHNVSQSDILFALRSKKHSDSSKETTSNTLDTLLIARPRFDTYAQITTRVLNALQDARELKKVYFPSKHYVDKATDSPIIPYGFEIEPAMEFDSFDGFRLRSSDFNKDHSQKAEIVAIYFPTLAVLLPKWLLVGEEKLTRRHLREIWEKAIANDQTIQLDRLKDIFTDSTSEELRRQLSENASSDLQLQKSTTPASQLQYKRILYFISGSGKPWNDSLDQASNSTKSATQLASMFIKEYYPQIVGTSIHSAADVFHYDANVRFIKDELKPLIDRLRRELVHLHHDEWRKFMHLTITITDAAPSRVTAITAALRSYKPDYLHMWQVKSFWHSFPRVVGDNERDVEFHSFEKLEMTPPSLVEDCGETVQALVKEMVSYKATFEKVRDGKRYHELDSFWLRKSNKPVLSVLMVKKKNEKPKFFHGVNTEVSLPTGSLCSERCAIGSAFSSDPSIVRKELKMIAVLALPLIPSEVRMEATTQMLANLTSKHPQLISSIKPSLSSLSDVLDSNLMKSQLSHDEVKDGGTRDTLPSQIDLTLGIHQPMDGVGNETNPRKEEARKQLLIEQELLFMKLRQEQAAGESEGRNPIDPCGTCNEWLKKIAETNPEFKIVTFTSSDCRTCIVKSVKF